MAPTDRTAVGTAQLSPVDRTDLRAGLPGIMEPGLGGTRPKQVGRRTAFAPHDMRAYGFTGVLSVDSMPGKVRNSVLLKDKK
jgi:hypothetical protein